MVRKVNKVKVVGGSTLTSEQQKTATPEELRNATLTPAQIQERTAQLNAENPLQKTALQNKAESQGAPLSAFQNAEETKQQFQERAQASPLQPTLTAKEIARRQQQLQIIANIQDFQKSQIGNIKEGTTTLNPQVLPGSILEASGFLTHSEKASALLSDLSNGPANEARGVFLASIGKIPGVKNINPLQNSEDYLKLTKQGVDETLADYEAGKASFADAHRAILKYAQATNQLATYVHLANKSYIVRFTQNGQTLEEEVVQAQRDIQGYLNDISTAAATKVNAGGSFA